MPSTYILSITHFVACFSTTSRPSCAGCELGFARRSHTTSPNSTMHGGSKQCLVGYFSQANLLSYASDASFLSHAMPTWLNPMPEDTFAHEAMSPMPLGHQSLGAPCQPSTAKQLPMSPSRRSSVSANGTGSNLMRGSTQIMVSSSVSSQTSFL